MDKVLAEFRLESGETFLAEVPEPVSADAVEEVSVLDEPVLKARQTFEASLDQVMPVASAAMEKLRSGLTTPADGIEVKFGLNLSADAGVIFASVGGEVNLEVTLRWGS